MLIRHSAHGKALILALNSSPLQVDVTSSTELSVLGMAKEALRNDEQRKDLHISKRFYCFLLFHQSFYYQLYIYDL